MRRLPEKALILFLLTTISIMPVVAQQQIRRITLDDAIEVAKVQSPDALNSKQQFKTNFWEYRAFRGTYLPQLGVSGTLPDLNRSIEKYTYPDGTESFIRQQYVSYNANMAISQKIGFTGGTVFVNSGLQRVDNFFDTSATLTSYLSTPINIGYTQPIFKFNTYKWDRKIEPLKYEQAKRKYLEDVEQISITATDNFFNLLQAQVEKKIALTNLSNYDTLYRIAKGRYEVGKIAENDLLSLELNVLKAQAAVENANLGLDNAVFKFRSYLRIKDTIPIELIPPANIDFFTINPNQAIDQAYKNSSQSLDFKRRLLEAARDVNMAKRDGRFDADLTAVFGLTQSATSLGEAYQKPLDQQQVAIAVTVPIVDWGVARGKIKMAQSQEEIVKTSVEQEEIDFRRNVYLMVVQFNMQKKQLMIAAKSDTVARKTYEVTKGRYLIGKINSILDLNNAQIQTDNAELSYYSTLQTYWRNYFELRKQTLYDFRNNRPLQFNFTDLR
jgi:outer membrane protein TolC